MVQERGEQPRRVAIAAGTRVVLRVGEHDRRARGAVLIGESADVLETLLGGRVTTRRRASMDEAVGLAAALAAPGDVVLLSPAAASFDMFADYAARGDAFRAAVAALDGGTP